MIDANLKRSFQERVERHLHGQVLSFWCGPALDSEHGGWMPWLTNDLRVDWTKPQGLIVNSRILWAFSAAYRAFPRPGYREKAELAFNVVMNRFWDRGFGGAFWRLDNNWQILEDSKKTYGQAFYIYALAEYYQAFGNTQALARAKELFALLEEHARDATHLGYWEVRNRDWTEAVDSRLSEKDMNESKSMNNHLHVLEAYTNLLRVWPEPVVKARLRELLDLFLIRITDPATKHLHHFFNDSWQMRSDTYTFGHDIEASWLLCEAAEVLGEPALEKRVIAHALSMAEAVMSEALDGEGALCYEGKRGKMIDPLLESWPQAEAVVGFLNAWQLSGRTEFYYAATRVWEFIENRLADRKHGEWFWRIHPDGTVDPDLPKVSEWKGPYHGTRCCLETIRRLSVAARHQ